MMIRVGLKPGTTASAGAVTDSDPPSLLPLPILNGSEREREGEGKSPEYGVTYLMLAQ
jgi:hypothetical protein